MNFSGESSPHPQQEVEQFPSQHRPHRQPLSIVDNPCSPQKDAQQHPIEIIANPYKKTRTALELERPAQPTTKKQATDVFKTMMDSQARTSADRQKKKRKQKETPSHGTISQRSAQAKRTVNRAMRRQSSTVVADDSSGAWQKRTKETISGLLNWLNSQVSFAERGNHGLTGEWPSLVYTSDVLEPSKDPQKWIEVTAAMNPAEEGFEFTKKLLALTPSDFVIPDVFLWSPETRWPYLYPEGRPCCPFHPGQTSCVVHKGFHHYARRCFSEKGNTAFIYRRYFCRVRQEKEENPYSFKGIDPQVIEAAPVYVKGFWKQNGYIFTARDAVSIGLMHRMRSSLANGSGASGFRKTLIESYQRTHRNRAKMWLGHLCCIQYEATKPVPCPFFQFDDPRSEIELPSLAWLLGVIVVNKQCVVTGGVGLVAQTFQFLLLPGEANGLTQHLILIRRMTLTTGIMLTMTTKIRNKKNRNHCRSRRVLPALT